MNQKEKSNQTILNIIDAGINEFAENGRLVSLNGICQKYNISKGKLYHHFSSKDELLCTCVCYALDNLTETIDNFSVNNNLSIKENFHNYYKERIHHWYENPNQLTVLRLAYSLRKKIFTSESLNELLRHQTGWRESKKKKILEIIHSNNTVLRMNDENIAEVILIMYENTFQTLEDKMLIEIKNNNIIETQKTAKELLTYHDTIIDMILYGAISE